MNWYEFASQAIDKVEELFEIKDPKDKRSRFIQYIHKNGCGDPLMFYSDDHGTRSFYFIE